MSLDPSSTQFKHYVELVKYMAQIYNFDPEKLPKYKDGIGFDEAEGADITEESKQILKTELGLPDWVREYYEEEHMHMYPGFDKHVLSEIGSYLPSINKQGEVLCSLLTSGAMFGEWETGPKIQEVVDSLAIDPTKTFDLPDELIKRNSELKELWSKIQETNQA